MSRLTLSLILLLPMLLPACATQRRGTGAMRPAAVAHSARRSLERADYGAALDASTREIEVAQRSGSRRDILDAYLLRGEALVGLQRQSEARGFLVTVKQDGWEQQRRDATALLALSHDREGNTGLACSYYRDAQPTSKVSSGLWRRIRPRFSREVSDSTGSRRAKPEPTPVAKNIYVYPRSRWAREPIRTHKAERMEPVRRITVHHTAMSAWPMPESAAAEQMRAIQRAHFARGWADIGYHYVIDPNGRVWEARSLRYQGAHAGNHELNRANVGVSLMGNFSKQKVRPPQKQALGDLLGMLSRRYGVESHEICGHCKLKNTECPGHNLRRDLPEIVAGMDRTQAPVVRTHRVARGETMSQIARRYGVSLGSLKAVNPGRGDHLRPGDEIAVP